MALWETMRGIIGEILLFIFVAAMVAAAASVLDMLDSPTPKEGAVLGTFFTLIAGILYAARTYWDEKRYKRFVVTTTLAPTLVVLSIANVAYTINIELVSAFFGTAVVFITAAGVAGFVYLFRWGYLIHRWRIRMRIKKHGKAGCHNKAIQEAEKAKCWPFQRLDYIGDPANFSSFKSAAIQLAQSLDALNRPNDATRVRLVANGWTVDQANSFLEEQAILADAHQMCLIQTSNR